MALYAVEITSDCELKQIGECLRTTRTIGTKTDKTTYAALRFRAACGPAAGGCGRKATLMTRCLFPADHQATQLSALRRFRPIPLVSKLGSSLAICFARTARGSSFAAQQYCHTHSASTAQATPLFHNRRVQVSLLCLHTHSKKIYPTLKK